MARFEKNGKVFEITSADARYTTELRSHLRDGWTRVADPRCEEPLGAEPIEPQLEAALRADPEDIGAALVYADWLQQRGHPRGALITVQHRLSLDRNDAALIEAERTIFEDARASLVSRALVAHLAILRDGVVSAHSQNLYEGGALGFTHGFIRTARIMLKRRGGDEDLLWEVLRHPSARALAELDVIVDESRDSALVAALITHGPRPPLRALGLRFAHPDASIDLAGLDEAYPQLASLDVTAHRVRFAELAVPLRWLALRGHSDLPRILASRTWDALESLEIPDDPLRFRDAFRAPILPRLRRLVLHGEGDIEVVCGMLLRSPVAPHLEHLEMRNLRLTQECVDLLIKHRARLPVLSTLLCHGEGYRYFMQQLDEAGFPFHKSPPKNGDR